MPEKHTTEKSIRPPRFAVRFLEWFCPPALHESIEGDLLQQFGEDMEMSGPRVAKRKFFWNVLKFFRPEIFLRNKFLFTYLNTIMIGNYFKVAARNIQKRKLYSFINAFGLSIGIAFSILIYLYIQDERSFDQFHANKNRIYRMEEKSYDTWHDDPKNPYIRSAYLQVPLKQALKDELPEVEYATRYNAGHEAVFRYGNKVFMEEVTYTDADFFNMFSFRLLSGNRGKLFHSKAEVVITPEIARKYFGEENPLGKTVEIDQGGPKSFTVTGVIEAPPANSSFNFSVMIPEENRSHYENSMKQWGSFSTPTFVQLVKGADLENFKANLDKVVRKYMGGKMEEWRKEVHVPDTVKMFELAFTPLPEMHLKKEISWEKVSDPQYSLILGGIAFLILIIAGINYISLALTTSAARRAEVGIRKAVGAQKRQLVHQFGFESVILAFISMIIGVGLAVLFLPSFNKFTEKEIDLANVNIAILVAVVLGVTILAGILAGSYPALFLSRFSPSIVLKGGFTSRVRAGFTRPLVVLQFALSAFLAISSVIMYRQMYYVTTKDLGYNKDQVLVIPTQTGWNTEADKMVKRFRAGLQDEPSVISVAGVSSSFNKGWSRYGYKIDGEQRSAYVYAVDPYYIQTLGLELVKGRNFDAGMASDSNAVIVNEALVRDMKWTDPLNQYLNWREDTLGSGAKVIGVLKDYHFLSLEQKIEPLFLSMDTRHSGFLTTMLVKIASGSLPGTVEKIRKAWYELSPDRPFDYSFLDDDVANQYKSYRRWMSIMSLSTGFALLIACLGLFGLAGINAVNRTKEIGIRKVMGAELKNIFILLNKQYVWLALIAFAIATPVSWYVMNKWLSSFQFKITIGWELFAGSMLAGMFVALITVSYHAIKAAWVNPVDTLKYE